MEEDDNYEFTIGYVFVRVADAHLSAVSCVCVCVSVCVCVCVSIRFL